jgi:hypothetical protein
MVPVLDRLSYRNVQRLLAAAILLHNLEEGLMADRYLLRSTALLQQVPLLQSRVPLVSLNQLYLALVVVTVVPALILVWGTTGANRPYKRYVVAMVAAALLWNVFLPHVPAAIAFGGYAPGVVTAVLINLPLTLYLFRRTRRENQLSAGRLAAAVMWGLVLLALAPLLLTRLAV